MHERISQNDLDNLSEIINIGASHASTALSQMVKRKVSVSIVEGYDGRVEKAFAILGETEKMTTTILLKILGDLSGATLLLLPPASAVNLVGLIVPDKETRPDELNEMDMSALREIGNILVGASLSALGNFLGLNVLQSVPEVAIDMLGSTTDAILAEFGRASDIVLIFRVSFSVEDQDITGRLFFLFDPVASEKILLTMKQKHG